MCVFSFTMASEHLANILTHAESLDLPEGLYLQVANALKTVCNATPAKSPVVIMPSSNIKMCFNTMNGDSIEIAHTNSVYYPSSPVPDSLEYHNRFHQGAWATLTIKQKRSVVGTLEINKECTSTLNTWMRMWNPMEIKVHQNGMLMEFDYEKYVEMEKRIGAVRDENGLENDEDISHDDFLNYVVNCFESLLSSWIFSKLPCNQHS